LPRGLTDARDNPIPASAFSDRFTFDPGQLRGSLIASFLKDRYNIDPGRIAEPLQCELACPEQVG
jgi:hypothetical protein